MLSTELGREQKCFCLVNPGVQPAHQVGDMEKRNAALSKNMTLGTFDPSGFICLESNVYTLILMEKVFCIWYVYDNVSFFKSKFTSPEKKTLNTDECKN